MNSTASVAVSDLALVIPELILIVTALALILLAPRIRQGPAAAVGTVLAALAAALASAWVLPSDTETRVRRNDHPGWLFRVLQSFDRRRPGSSRASLGEER